MDSGRLWRSEGPAERKLYQPELAAIRRKDNHDTDSNLRPERIAAGKVHFRAEAVCPYAMVKELQGTTT